MHRHESPNPTERVARLARQLSLQPRLEVEVMRARRQFLGSDAEVTVARDRAREHRFAEWFLLERESEMLGAVPAAVPPFVAHSEDLRDSLVGAFLVQSIGATVTGLDLQDDSILELAVGPGVLQVGDLLVGRLYEAPGECWQPSAAAPVLRPGRDIATAFARDLDRLALSRRLQQIEIEHLLLRKVKAAVSFTSALPADEVVAPLEHLEADLEQLLISVGGKHSATWISQQLADAPRPGPLLGPMLDQLAFDTDVDLERAQRLLLEIWNAHHAGFRPSTEQVDDSSTGPTGPPGLSLGEQLVRTLDEGLAQHRDVEDLFRQIEQMAGIEDDDDELVPDVRDVDDDDEPTDNDDSDDDDATGRYEPRRRSQFAAAAGDDDADAGDLDPLVTEYLWETEQSESPAATTLQLWVDLQRNAALQRTDVETIVAQDLMRLLLHVYLRSVPSERAALVRGAYVELQRFFDWLHVVHEVDRRMVLQQCQGTLLEHLDRLANASRLLSNQQQPTVPPGILQIEDLGADGFGVRDDDGAHHWLLADPQAVAELRLGDLLLGGIAVGADIAQHRLAGLVVVLPVDARALIE